jgi:ribosomal protein S12 methylthiotransferase
LQWLEEAALDRVGCFKYEPVRGAAANDSAPQVADEVKEERWHRFMQAQQKISAAKLAAKVGREIDVIVDAVEKGHAVARSKADAPEIDGNVFVAPATGIKVGDIVKVRVEKASEYDLEAKPVA